MFFKEKISIDLYLQTRLDLLFSNEQINRWLQLKKSLGEELLISVNDDLFLEHIEAAHIEVIYMVLSKRYADNSDIPLKMEDYIKFYLIKNNQSYINELLPLYSKALASTPTDGVLGLAKLLSDSVCPDSNTVKAVNVFSDQLYNAVGSIHSDFKTMNIVF
jgi:hypothetical protein